MLEYEDECCGCATESYPCLGSCCERRNVPHYYCDKCGNEETLYKYLDLELCKDCLIEEIIEDTEIVEGSDKYL